MTQIQMNDGIRPLTPMHKAVLILLLIMMPLLKLPMLATAQVNDDELEEPLPPLDKETEERLERAYKERSVSVLAFEISQVLRQRGLSPGKADGVAQNLSGRVFHLDIEMRRPAGAKIFHKDPETLEIVAEAINHVGRLLLQQKDWKTRYFKLRIEKEHSLDQLNYLFLTEDCKKYRRLVLMEGSSKALKLAKALSLDALKRYESKPEWYNEN